MREVIGFALDDLREAVEQFRAQDSAHASPGRERFTGSGDSFAGVCFGSQREDADGFTEPGGICADEGLARRRAPLAGEVMSSVDRRGHGVASSVERMTQGAESTRLCFIVP